MTNPENVEMPNINEIILEILENREYPIPEERLVRKIENQTNLNISKNELRDAIEIIRNRGYDVKEVDGKEDKSLFHLVRQTESRDKRMYRSMGKIETPLLLASDTHIGHAHFSEQAWNKLVDVVIDRDIKNIMFPGDALQGLGVHRVEAKDIIEPDIDSQVRMAKNYFEQIPNDCTIHFTIGNHEQKMKGKHKVGYDALRHLASLLDNAKYYGSVAEFTLNDDYRYVMMHGGGGGAYARSYKLQKIWRSLPEPRPHLVHIGHYHIMQPVPMTPNRLLICSGTFQRESSYIIWKGKKTQVGFYLLNEYSEDKHELEAFIPKIY